MCVSRGKNGGSNNQKEGFTLAKNKQSACPTLSKKVWPQVLDDVHGICRQQYDKYAADAALTKFYNWPH